MSPSISPASGTAPEGNKALTVPPPALEIRGYGGTDTGRVREHNEDAFLLDDDLRLYVVADGVGGHNAGEIASGLVVRYIHKEAKGLVHLTKSFDSKDLEARRALIRAIPRLIHNASDVVFRYAFEHPECQGMATTAVVFMATGRNAYISHAGDSRAYLLRGDRFCQLTEDHTLVQKLVKEGQLSEGEAAVHPQRNVIIRSVGITPGVECDTLYIDVQPSDLFLICSDGLTDMVQDEEIHELALRYRDEALVAALIQRANARGGRDNITVLLLEVEDAEEESGGPEKPTGEFPADGFDVLQKTAFLRNVFMFKHCNDQERMKAARCMQVKSYDVGDKIIEWNDEGDDLYLVAEGQVEVLKDDVHLADLTVGECFGELSFISRYSRTATVRATTAAKCFVMARHDLHELLSDDAVLGNKLLWNFLENLGESVKRLSLENADLKGAAQAAARKVEEEADDTGP